ncbi:NAD(P)H-quinone oxidoreductase, partial [Xanthomonas hortorum pv. vitians]|nr:NAD(P)H-quinone oxidoreductase [Xanthomonas hortorum pv. vitians]
MQPDRAIADTAATHTSGRCAMAEILVLYYSRGGSVARL